MSPGLPWPSFCLSTTSFLCVWTIKSIRHLKLEAIGKFLKLDIGWHQKHNSGSLVGKVANGVTKVNDIIDVLSWETVSTIMQAILSFIALYFVSAQTIPVTITAFALFLVLTYKSAKVRESFRKKRYDFYEDEWQHSIESVQGIETALMFGQTGRLNQELKTIHDGIVDSGLGEFRIGVFRYNRWRIRILTVARRIALILWVLQLRDGTLDVANFIFVTSLTEKLFSSFWRFARIFDRLVENSEAAKRLTDIYAEKIPAAGGTSPKITGAVGISLKDVCFSYEKKYSEDDGILHDFSLEIPAGKIVAFVGPSGAGKTTIRRLITGLYPIQNGEITVAGLPVGEWTPSSLLSLFSYVPQGDDVNIWARSFADNIAFAKPQATIDEVIEAAKLAGIDDFIQSLTGGYKTMLGERGKRLSGGQKQRVALARAIIADRPILILDEATSALDSIKEKELQTNLKKILSGKTAIVIAHRLSTIWDLADKIVVMDNGRKVEEGTHQELVKLGGLYARLVSLQTA